MPRGAKPDPPGTSKRQRAQWKLADGEGWQHGDVPDCPAGLTDIGQKAWRTWLGAWWACFYTPDDLPGLELLVNQYDLAMRGAIDPKKVESLMDKYGVTPHGRQSLRWAQTPVEPAESESETQDEVAERRNRRERAIS